MEIESQNEYWLTSMHNKRKKLHNSREKKAYDTQFVTYSELL